MPFWKRKPPDPEIEAARAEAEASLPPGWSIHRSDLETFRLPGGRVETYGICAAGPGGETALVVAVGEANAFRHFSRHMRGEIQPAEGWAVPLPATYEGKPNRGYGDVRNANDRSVLEAKAELDAALPPGWHLFNTDRERYFFPGGYLETWAMVAAGPEGQTELTLGIGEAGAFRQLARRLRGDLEITEAWAPPMEYLQAR